MVNTAIIAIPKQLSFPKDIIKSKVKWFQDEHSTLIQLCTTYALGKRYATPKCTGT